MQERGINLTHIESRPSRKNKEEYEFFISVDQASSKAMDEVVDSLRTQISGQVHELSRNKQKDTGETQGNSLRNNSSLPMRKGILRSERNTTREPEQDSLEYEEQK